MKREKKLEIAEKIRAITQDGEDLIQTFIEILKNRDARDADRLRAAEFLFERAFGRPPPAADFDAQQSGGPNPLDALNQEQLQALRNIFLEASAKVINAKPTRKRNTPDEPIEDE